MKKTTLLLLILFVGFCGHSQIGVGTVAPDSTLDIVALNPTGSSTAVDGILIPRVDRQRALGMTGIITSTMIYVNSIATGTATGKAANITSTGFYFYDGTLWQKITTGTNNNWTLTGNAGTGSSNYVGTSDAVDFKISTDGNERMRALSNGQIVVNNTGTPAAADRFSVYNTTTSDNAISGYSTLTGTGVYGQNTGSGRGVRGITFGTGSGISGLHNSTTSVGVAVYGQSLYGNGYSFYGVDGIASSDNSFYGGDAFEGYTSSTLGNAIWAVNANNSGTGVLGASGGISVYGNSGSGVAGSGNKIGVFGYAGLGARANANRGNAAGQFTLDTDANPATNGANTGNRASAQLAGFSNVAYTNSSGGTGVAADSYFGGYFSGGNESGTTSYAYAGLRYNTNTNGTTGTDFKIVGPGSNSTIIFDKENTPRILFSPEAPEIVFQDFGVGQLKNGEVTIKLDPILKESLFIDEKHPLKVFITLEGECNGVFVTNKSKEGFTVKELRNGSTNTAFSWQIVANRADTKNADGEVTSKHVDLRLPVGPGPLKVEAKTKESDNKRTKIKKYSLEEAENKVPSKEETK